MRLIQTLAMSTVAHLLAILAALEWWGLVQNDHAFGIGLVVGTFNSLLTTILMLGRHMPLVLEIFGWRTEE